jgi:hypothetical protein
MSWGRPVGGASLPRTTDAHEAEAGSQVLLEPEHAVGTTTLYR